MKNKTTTLQAKGEFPFTFYIEKAVPIEENGLLIVEGVASTINVDHDNERMAQSALQSMATIINQRGVPLRLEHNKDEAAVVGGVYKAWVDERNQLWVRAAIDAAHPAGPTLHESLKQGAKFGLSVGGRVKNAVRELVESTGKMVKTFYDVELDEVSVTRRPANYDAWLFAKSFKGETDDVTPFYKSVLYQEFLFENQQLDYMRQFAKSIPDKAWVIVNKNNLDTNNMNEDEKKKEDEAKKSETDSKESKETTKSEDEKEEKEKSVEDEKDAEKSYVTKGEFSKFADSVTKGMAAIAKALETGAKETTNPDKDKPEDDTQQTAKSEEEKDSEEKEKSEADGDNGKSEAADKPKDTTNPEKDKPVEETQQTAKSEEGKEDKEEKEKSEDEKDPVSEATKSIIEVTKRLSGNKISKSIGKEAAIDQFAIAMSKAVSGMEERLEKSGHRIPGLTSMFADIVKGDPAIQEALKAMILEPGFKKSVSMGNAYMVGKDGKRFALTASPVASDEVNKSRAGKDFKSVFKSEFSSFRSEDQA